MEIYPTGLVTGWGTIIYMEVLTGSYISTMWFVPESTQVAIYDWMNGSVKSQRAPSELPFGHWAQIKIRQTLQENGEYLKEFEMNGNVFYSVVNTTPKEWKDVKLYVTDNKSYEPAKVSIRNFRIYSENPGKFF